MKLLLVSINFRQGNTTQRDKHHSLDTLFVVTLPAGNYTLVLQAIHGHTHLVIESSVKPCSQSTRARC